MSADFNAGSIEGTLDLDSSPFKAGLVKAKMDATDFENSKITPKADLDKTKFDAKKAVANAEADKLDHKKIEPKADIDTSAFLAKYAILNRMLDAGGLGKGSAGFAGSASKVSLLVSGLLSVIAAAGPAGAAMGAFGAASVAALGGVYISLGLFAAAAKSAFGEIEKANKAGVTLTGWAGKAQGALKGVTDAWHHLINGSQSQVMKVLFDTFQGISGILPKLAPLLRVTAFGVDGIVRAVFDLTKQPIFERFLHSLESFMHGFLAGAGPVIVNLLHMFMAGFIALRPLMDQLGHGILIASNAAEHFVTGGGLTKFLGYAKTAIPEVTALLGHLVHGLFNLVSGLRPLAGPALAFLGALVEAVGNLNLTPLAHGIGQVLNAITPLLPVAGQLINIVLKPLGHLLTQIAHGPLRQITNGIQTQLRPAFSALRGILHDLVRPLAEFVGSIANLANPTGIHILAVSLKSLQGLVHTLAPAFGKLAVAVEGVIDNGLNTLIPLVPVLARGLKAVAGALVPVVNLLAGLIAHRAVADVILGIVGAVWLWQKAILAYVAVTKGFALVQGIVEAVSFGWNGLTVAQDANKASVIANKATMVAYWAWSKATVVGNLIAQAAAWTLQKGAMLASAAASKVVAAAQAALNIVMDANPIMLVVLAVAALAAGLIYAYTHSQKFREIVNAAFTDVKNIAKNVFDWLAARVVSVIDFVQAHWQLLVAIMTGPVGMVTLFVIDHFTQIRDLISSVISTVVNTVSNGISNVVSWFESLPGKIMALGGQMVTAGRNLMESIFHGIESVASAAGGFASNIAGAIWNDLKSTLNAILPHSIGINKGPIHLKVPLFPYLAKGGITDGQTTFVAGDNPGGREAVIPLDKYDLPRRGESDRHAHQNHADQSQIIALLATIAAHLSGNNDGLAEAIAHALDTHNTKMVRQLIQAGRAT